MHRCNIFRQWSTLVLGGIVIMAGRETPFDDVEDVISEY